MDENDPLNKIPLGDNRTDCPRVLFTSKSRSTLHYDNRVIPCFIPRTNSAQS